MSSDSIDWGETAEEGGEVAIIIAFINIPIVILIIIIIMSTYRVILSLVPPLRVQSTKKLI